MPIKFRCRHCDQFLGISRAKAGTIADCPSCGRTIRVPNLDGKVDPLPKPKLNLKDDDLVKALGALASLDREQGSNPHACGEGEEGTRRQDEPERKTGASPDAPEQRSAAPGGGPAAPTSVPAALQAEPIEVEAPLPAHPVAWEQRHPEREATLELEILPDLDDSRARAPAGRQLQFGAAVLLLGCVVSLVCGLFIGRTLAPPRSGAVQAPPARNVVEAALPENPPQAALPEGNARIEGRVMYAGPSGDSRPDRGARVLVLPLTREGTAKLSSAGFRVGADEADRQLMAAAVRALGGDFTSAEHDGRFKVTIPGTGRVGVLIASRYQSRDDSGMLPAAVSEFISTYFDRSDLLIGQVRYYFQTFTAEPGSEIEFDYEFPPG